MTAIDQRIDAGVAWLDKHVPDWLDRIDLDRLAMGDTCKCVLGQTFAHVGRWSEGPSEGSEVPGYDLVLEEWRPGDPGVTMACEVPFLPSGVDSSDFGFDVGGSMESYPALADRWRRRIAALRADRQAVAS